MVVRLRSLGECVIETPTTRLGPEAEILFATALYVVVERGRRIPREAIAQLLWPEVRPARAAHSLRQAFYKLRTFGVPLAAGRVDVTLPAAAVDADYAALFETHDPQAAEQIAERVSGGFLAGYAPTFSPPFTEWLEQQRDAVNSAIRRVLVSAIVARKRQADWRAAELYARRCVTLDPLNEEATLALAEAAALHGSKAEALRILDGYLKEIGANAREIRLPALALRRRVSEATTFLSAAAASRTPFVGREADIALLGEGLTQANHGAGGAYLIWGEAGIGKTRLVNEFAHIAELQGRHAIRVVCQSHDERRPLSAFVDAVPRLLSLPGALGCSPESMRYLRRIERHDASESVISPDARESEVLRFHIRRSLFDLLDAITAEICLVLIVEDVQWLDAMSRELLTEFISWLSTRRVLLLLTARGSDLGNRQQFLDNTLLRCRRLSSLGDAASRHLVEILLEQSGRSLGVEFCDWCVRTAAGNPYYLNELALHAQTNGVTFQPPVSLARLISDRLSRLSSVSRRVLQACAVLGKHSTLERLEGVLNRERLDLLDSLDDLEANGLIEVDGSHVQSKHETLSRVAIEQLSYASRRLLHRHTALLLQKEMTASQSSALLWECAEHWQAAGDPERAIELLTSCARHSLELGLPLQAAEILDQALALCNSPAERAALCRELIPALHLSGQWQRLHAALSDLAKLPPSLGRSDGAHRSWTLMAIEAKLHCGYELGQLLGDLQSHASSRTIAPGERVSAATMALMLADNLCEKDSAAAIHQSINACLTDSEVSEGTKLHYLLVYHSAFGSHEEGVLAARAFVSCERAGNNPASTARALRHSAEVLWRAGLGDEAVAMAEEAYTLAVQYHLNSAASAAANYLANAQLRLGAIADADRWYRLALARLVDADDPGMTASTYGTGAEVALGMGRLAEAEQLLTSSEVAWRDSLHWRGRARIAATRRHIRLAGRVGPSAAPDAKELIDLYHRTKTFSDQDQLVSAILASLHAQGAYGQARALVKEFLGLRRDRSPLAHSLQCAMRRLGALEDGLLADST